VSLRLCGSVTKSKRRWRIKLKLIFALSIALFVTLAVAQEPTPAQPVAPAESQAKAAETPAAPDPREIVQKSVELDRRNARLIGQTYTYQFRAVERDIDKSGALKKTVIHTYDHVFLYGADHNRLVAKDDKPLSEKEEREEEKKIEKMKEKYEHESESDRQKRAAEREKELDDNRKFLKQIPEAYDFELKGSETVDGHDTWMIGLTPRPDFKPTVKFADILKKIKATLWIDKQEYQWVKVDAQLLDDATFGLFLVRLHKGARLQFEQTKVNDEVWFTRWSRVEGSARVALFVNARGDEETTFSNYRKFRTDAKITGVSEVPAAPATPPQ
jgi:hypothetical protein